MSVALQSGTGRSRRQPVNQRAPRPLDPGHLPVVPVVELEGHMVVDRPRSHRKEELGNVRQPENTTKPGLAICQEMITALKVVLIFTLRRRSKLSMLRVLMALASAI